MAEQADGPFEMKGLIGQGAFGKVFLLQDDKGNKRALKQLSLLGRGEKEIMMMVQEIKILADLDNAHVLKYIHAFRDGISLFLVTEFCPNGDIDKYLTDHQGQKLEEGRLLLWIKQIVGALEYIHGKCIIHRDLKTANIFLDDKWDTKLGDFGIARVLASPTDMATTVCGTPMYMSPEVFLQKPYTDKTDIFSLGVMALEMTYMETGMEGLAPHLMIFKIMHLQMPNVPDGYTSGVTDLIQKMIALDPAKRPSATDLLKHQVFAAKTKPEQPKGKNKAQVTPFKPEQNKDFDWTKIKGTLTLLRQGRMFSTDSVKADAAPGKVPNMDEEFAANPVMSVVVRTLGNMGFDHNVVMKGKSFIEKQAQMLKMYCMKCLDQDEKLFKKGSEALDSDKTEDEIEEDLIEILGHEKFALCGIQLLYYKNFTFLLRK